MALWWTGDVIDTRANRTQAYVEMGRRLVGFPFGDFTPTSSLKDSYDFLGMFQRNRNVN